MKRKDSFMLGSFNICSAHFQEKRYTDKNLRLIAGKIRESGADVVALQEVDRGAERSKGVDMPTAFRRCPDCITITSSRYGILKAANTGLPSCHASPSMRRRLCNTRSKWQRRERPAGMSCWT